MNKYEAMIARRDEWMQIARDTKAYANDAQNVRIAVKRAREWNRQALIIMRCHVRYGFPLEVVA